MNVARALILLAAVSSMSPLSTRAAAQAPPRPAAPALDYEFFKTRVQPIFLAERPGHARCIACHGSGTPMRLQALTGGRNSLDRGGVAQELRRGAANGRARQREEPAADASARRTGRRRLLSQRRQALDLAERPRVADGESLGDGRDRARRAPGPHHPDEQRRRQRPHHRSRRPTPSSASSAGSRPVTAPARHRMAAASTSATRPRARSTWSTRSPSPS